MLSSNVFSDLILGLKVKVCAQIFKYFHFCSARYHCDGDFGGKQENSLNITRSRSIFDTSNVNIDDHDGWLQRIKWVSKRETSEMVEGTPGLKKMTERFRESKRLETLLIIR